MFTWNGIVTEQQQGEKERKKEMLGSGSLRVLFFFLLPIVAVEGGIENGVRVGCDPPSQPAHVCFILGA